MKILVFLGTVRDSSPPNPPRLGARVAEACMAVLGEHADLELELVDPLDYSLEGVFKPHFAYHQRKVPEDLEALAGKIEQADGYVMVSPEYNHSMSPALANLLNHFGSSLFSYKPSAIVSYSAGQWGGLRAAVAMRTFLSELGCLPVSAMIHVPKAQDIFAEDGGFQEGVDGDEWAQYFNRTFLQLIWWAKAACSHREAVDPHGMIKSFKNDPSQRNAP
ncbi:NAD(P)H-dependent FMN reductase [Natronospira proteinivora]|uniref:NAD(P)H-dependent FMN reductase n=1 Tax=Natronospira proteinivora TaxID=1807133 RepID=A0ABT1GB75_9GAMM|nr:NAD(P)H-dependent oxidoreductase [Natronospira proteinivora]MCP1728576.1 NAD(P)H-dependent FMN reductase [Natronospira proteinivora]